MTAREVAANSLSKYSHEKELLNVTDTTASSPPPLSPSMFQYTFDQIYPKDGRRAAKGFPWHCSISSEQILFFNNFSFLSICTSTQNGSNKLASDFSVVWLKVIHIFSRKLSLSLCWKSKQWAVVVFDLIRMSFHWITAGGMCSLDIESDRLESINFGEHTYQFASNIRIGFFLLLDASTVCDSFERRCAAAFSIFLFIFQAWTAFGRYITPSNQIGGIAMWTLSPKT